MTLSRLRQLMQLLSTILSNSYIGVIYTRTINTNILKGVCVPFLNCYSCPTALFSCPIGTLQHFSAIHAIPFYLLSFLSIVGVAVGRMACGWICPFGFFQDLMYKIPSNKHELPYHLKYIKYFIFIIFVIVLPYQTGDMWFSMLCPAGTLTAGIPWALWNPVNPETGQQVLQNGPGAIFYLSLIVLMGFLIWFVFVKRPFCRAVCPMGAFFALFNKFCLVQLEVNHKCDGCDICKSNCPVDLNVAVEFDSGECIRCLECTRCEHVKVKKITNNEKHPVIKSLRDFNKDG
uniref:Magnetosome protein Mad6 n=1 Tax=Candidatus Magnetananas rongchengensis TaxID=1463558 RepID=A0A3S6J2U6_9BACT|nr:magnetosome protein Mad6 [Candidatus Magnetananas rongchenensis]